MYAAEPANYRRLVEALQKRPARWHRLGTSCKRRESRSAARSQASGATDGRWRAVLPSASDDDGGFKAPRIARRCPGRTNEQTRSSSASERGRQRLPSAILTSGASNQHCRNSCQQPAASVGNRAPAVLRTREQRCFSSASDDEVGGSMRAMREQLLKIDALMSTEPGTWKGCRP
jgi:hypothetical protein